MQGHRPPTLTQHMQHTHDATLHCVLRTFHGQKFSNKKAKTYNSGYSPVVTHLTTNPPVHCLSTAERTGSSIFSVLWSYVEDNLRCKINDLTLAFLNNGISQSSGRQRQYYFSYHLVLLHLYPNFSVDSFKRITVSSISQHTKTQGEIGCQIEISTYIAKRKSGIDTFDLDDFSLAIITNEPKPLLYALFDSLKGCASVFNTNSSKLITSGSTKHK
jgi:hypothetical protein